MSLVRKKVQEFEAINGTHSMPNAVVEETGDKVRRTRLFIYIGGGGGYPFDFLCA